MYSTLQPPFFYQHLFTHRWHDASSYISVEGGTALGLCWQCHCMSEVVTRLGNEESQKSTSFVWQRMLCMPDDERHLGKATLDSEWLRTSLCLFNRMFFFSYGKLPPSYHPSSPPPTSATTCHPHLGARLEKGHSNLSSTATSHISQVFFLSCQRLKLPEITIKGKCSTAMFS